MNRKNLTAAVLAGLAGVAGLAATAQAVNLNPDGLGQVLIYPYYTSNAGNQTILSVVNTTDQAKAVKVRFLEGYNSREVLDFNLYMSAYDVWVAAIADGGDLGFAEQAGVPHLVIPDTSCTVPYLYGDSVEAGLDFGLQAFLTYAYSGKNADGGPTDISRATEGHIEMIEMGTLTDDSERAPKTLGSTDPGRMGSAEAATHVVVDGEDVPADCYQLVRNWTDYDAGAKDDPYDGMWFEEATFGESEVAECDVEGDDQSCTDTTRNSGGLFGGAAVVNSGNGTMFSYDAKAVQGFDKSDDGIHFVPGTIYPSLNSGSENVAYVFFGTPSYEVQELYYPFERSVEAVSALFMHDNVMNTFTIQEDLDAATEWVLTFPTKSFYVDPEVTGLVESIWIPDQEDPFCNDWEPGDDYPPGGENGVLDPDTYPDWTLCTYVEIDVLGVQPPFTEVFDGEACEIVGYKNWNREESPTVPGTPGSTPPIVSPAPPGTTPGKPTPFELCYEVNVLRFGEESIFGTDSDILRTVTGTPDSGWAKIDFSYVADFKDGAGKIERHQDRNGLVGLPVTGFSAEEFENGFLEGGSVLANYGGLFQHKASVRRISAERCYHEGDCE
jgi:hypothetical protein